MHCTFLSQRVLKQIVQNTGDREESRYKNKVCIHISPIYYMYICTYVYTYTGEPHICTNICFNLLANVYSVFSVLFLMLWRRRSLLQAVLAAVTKFLWKLLLCVAWSWQKHVPMSMTMTTQSYDTLWLSCKLHCRYEVFVLLAYVLFYIRNTLVIDYTHRRVHAHTHTHTHACIHTHMHKAVI